MSEQFRGIDVVGPAGGQGRDRAFSISPAEITRLWDEVSGGEHAREAPSIVGRATAACISLGAVASRESAYVVLGAPPQARGLVGSVAAALGMVLCDTMFASEVVPCPRGTADGDATFVLGWPERTATGISWEEGEETLQVWVTDYGLGVDSLLSIARAEGLPGPRGHTAPLEWDRALQWEDVHALLGEGFRLRDFARNPRLVSALSTILTVDLPGGRAQRVVTFRLSPPELERIGRALGSAGATLAGAHWVAAEHPRAPDGLELADRAGKVPCDGGPPSPEALELLAEISEAPEPPSTGWTPGS